jgi:3-hydroxyisobutyrate dehydrogenase-like beta-hydroxyacid dehydrogenase
MVRLVQIVGIVSPGAMGSAVGAAYLAAGNRVVATVDGRSARTTGLAEEARLELLPDLDAVVGESELVLSIVPPGEAGATAAAIAAAAGRTGARPLVADWNAVSPATVRQLEQELAEAGLELVDGSISGGPPRADYRTRVYFSGRSAAELAAAAPAWIDARTVGDTVGLASAVKMCTASMYKGSSALLTHALLTAHAHGVLPQVLDDLGGWFPRQIDRAARTLAVSATKADRYVGEMREIAATQASVGLTPALFEAMAEVYESIAQSAIGAEAPEEITAEPDLMDVLNGLSGGRDGEAKGNDDEGVSHESRVSRNRHGRASRADRAVEGGRGAGLDT